MLYRKIIAVCSQIHTEDINTLCGQNVKFLNVKPGGTYSNHWALKGNMAELAGILDMGPFQQYDLHTYIKFHYNTALQNKLSTHALLHINSNQHSQSSKANSS